jgi:hypothetical protein
MSSEEWAWFGAGRKGFSARKPLWDHTARGLASTWLQQGDTTTCPHCERAGWEPMRRSFWCERASRRHPGGVGLTNTL